jgi:hypothetical protein
VSVFFNGKMLVSPTTASRVEDSALANRNPNIRNVVAFIGHAEGGHPNLAYPFGTPVDARRVLRSGALLDAIERAFDPSPETDAPQRIVAFRVDPSVQAALALADGDSNASINLLSTDYGLYTNQIKVKIETGTNSGKRITTQLGTDLYTGDDIGRRVLDIEYTGAEVTAWIKINGTTRVLEAPASTPVATISLAAYPSVQSLVDRINAVPGFEANVLDQNGEHPTLNALDGATDQSVMSAFVVRADLQACVDWFNGATEGLVDAVRAAGAVKPPANIAFTYLAGGATGSAAAQDWSDCLDSLQNEDVQWIVPLTSDQSVHAQLVAHCEFMSGHGRRERRGFVGGALGDSIQTVKTAAALLNSDRVSQVYPGVYDFNRNGVLELRPPYMAAAVVAAAFGGLAPASAMTNRAIRARGVEFRLRNPIDTDELLLGGVLPIEQTETGFRVVQSISTWLTNGNYNRREVSVGWGYDTVSRALREGLDQLVRGKKGSPELIASAIARAQSILDNLARPESAGGPGILVGDEESPPYRGLTISIEADVMRCDVQASVAIPVNYNLITIYAVPFTGSATA